ncbi:MAG: hypothetical protein GX616_25910 [Planctomycetes bacterium]|nr:hypothetical protein [Planctomycetota bacterium]
MNVVLCIAEALLTAGYVVLHFVNVDWVAQKFDEATHRVHRLRLLRIHHPELLRLAERIPVRRLAQESFTAQFKRGSFDSRGLVFLTEDAVMYWDLGQSTLLDPYVFRPGEASAMLHRSEPYRRGEHIWVQLEGHGSSRYLQCEEAPANEKTLVLFERIDAILHKGGASA